MAASEEWKIGRARVIVVVQAEQFIDLQKVAIAQHRLQPFASLDRRTPRLSGYDLEISVTKLRHSHAVRRDCPNTNM